MSNTRVVPGPGFRICFDDEPGYLRAYVFDGIDSLEVSLSMWRILTDECEATSSKQLLVVEDLHGTVEPAGIAVLVDAVSRRGMSELRVAFVELREDIQSAELGEILATERGMTIRAFSQESDARRWLLYGS
ncbi:MAG: hypothetical protein ABIP44_07795 [Pseudoxanthomonas sp.]